MMTFFLGWWAGSILMNNRSNVRHALAVALVKSEDAMVATTRHAYRVAAQVREDLEDIVAEAHAGRSAR
jgi:hypothetical protein